MASNGKAVSRSDDQVALAISKANARLSLRERSRAATEKVKLAAQETVDIPAHDLKFLVKPAPVGTRLDFITAVQDTGKLTTTEYLINLVQSSTYDPETNELVWTEEQRKEVYDLSDDIFTPLSAAAQRVNVVSTKQDAALENDSAPTESAE